jgi:uncharacterized protein
VEQEEGRVGSVPWTVRDVWIGVGVLAAWMAAVVAAAALFTLYQVDVDAGLYVSLGEMVLLAPVWVLGVRKARDGWRAVGLRDFAPAAVGLGCGLMIVSYLLNLAYSVFLMQFDLRMQVDMVPILEGLTSPWAFVLGTVVVAPVVEEIFFRGFVFAGLRQRYDWKVAAVISAALFAVIHLQPLAVLPIFFLGLIFAFLYQWSGSIWPAILMHVSTNTLAVAAAYGQLWLQEMGG